MKTVIATCLILAVSVMAFFCIFERVEYTTGYDVWRVYDEPLPQEDIENIYHFYRDRAETRTAWAVRKVWKRAKEAPDAD